MKTKLRSLFSLTSPDVDQLESNLIERDPVENSIAEMEDIFIQTKVLNSLIRQEEQKKTSLQQSAHALQKRILHIEQLERTVRKQTSLVKAEAGRVNDALVMNRILIMQRLLLAQRQAEDLRRKRQTCHRIKTEKKIKDQTNSFSVCQKLQRVRLESLSNTVAIRNELNQVRCNTMQLKRKQALQIKLTHQRQRYKSKQIQVYKRLRARNNYLSKVQDIRQEIQAKQKALDCLNEAQQEQETVVYPDAKAGEECAHSFFPTQDVSI